MSRTKVDVIRSLKRYIVDFLDEEFDVRIESEDTTWARPSVIIDTAAQVPTGGPKIMDIVMPVTIFAYPEEKSSGEAAKLEALRVEDLFIQAFRIGGHGGRPCRTPLFSFDVMEPVLDKDEKVIGEQLPEGAKPEGMIWLLDFNTDTRRDPEDEKLQTVIVEGRVRWTRPGEIRSTEPMAKDLVLGDIVLK